MASGHAGTVVRELGALLGAGTVAGLSDAELLGRFTARRDQAAFAALVTRHGPMVFRVCRELLGDRHLAEDAFQAVFVVLARRAGAIRDPDRLGPWLYGVALRTAKEAKARLVRQRRREAAMTASSFEDHADAREPERREEAVALHEEIGRLPERYRTAVVLCYFEDLTHEEAAVRLRTAVGTISVRLMRAREILRSRLTRRGLAPGVALLASSSQAAEASPPAIPPELLESTVRAALATGPAGALAVCVLKGMAASRAVKIVAISLALALGSMIAGGLLRAAPGTQAPAKSEQKPDAKAEAPPAETLDLLVTEARTGNPVPGATLTVSTDNATRLTTDSKGRCRVPMPTGPAEDLDLLVWIDLWKEGFAPVRLSATYRQLRERTMRSHTVALEPAVAMGGTAQDEQGRPIAGAKVMVGFIRDRPDERGRWREQVMCAVPDSFTTDAKGHWDARLLPENQDGLQLVYVTFRHPDYLSEPGRPSGFVPSLRSLQDGTHVAVMKAGVPISGTVLDAEARPVGGASVKLNWNEDRFDRYVTRTDAEGRFVFAHARPGPQTVTVESEESAPALEGIDAKPDSKPLTIWLTHGRTVRGRVIDADGRTVPGAVLRVARWRARQTLDWKIKTDSDGRFRWENAPDDLFVLAAKSSARESREVEIPVPPHEFELTVALGESSRAITGVVRGPGSATIPDADVVVVSQSKPVPFVRDGRVTGALDERHVRTDADGRFSLARPAEPYVVLVVSARGVALKTSAELAAAPEVTVESWGRVEGTVRVGPQAGAALEVRAHTYRSASPDEPAVGFQYQTRADARGRFLFDRLPPGTISISRAVPNGRSGTSFTNTVSVEVPAGRTVSANVGGMGRPVIGRIARPADTVALIDFAESPGWLIADQPRPFPADFRSWPPHRQRYWMQAFSRTEEGKAYLRGQGQYVATLKKDGSFRFEDVLNGRYTLTLRIQKGAAGARRASGPAIAGMVQRTVDIPELPGGRSDEPLDLGALEMTLADYRRVDIGDPAPSFTVKTVDGKPLALTDYRGKFLLLDFWATWCRPCLADTPHLKATYDAFGRDERFAMIGLSLDENVDELRTYVERHELAWPQGILESWASSPVPPSFGVQAIPSIWLIGPDGKVLAKDLRGPGIKGAVANALGLE
jgi:RNA polymerase sigma factor (sigma-70 family)